MNSDSHEHSSRSVLFKIKSCMLVLNLMLVFGLVVSVDAQTFSSGSTGADGAFAPTANQVVQTPESGVFNFTTVNIPADVTITFKRNSKNTPVVILASGDVIIAGIINVDGNNGVLSFGGFGGPGGFQGGFGGYVYGPFDGNTGDGPGGGGGGQGPTTADQNIGSGGGGGFATTGGDGSPSTKAGKGGSSYGTRTLLPLIGGSGGGGGAANPSGGQTGGGGGGGGGAILIASSGTISFNGGGIFARGGRGASTTGSGGGGAGGAIRLVANTVAGSPPLNVSGGGNGGGGFIRVEAFDITAFNPLASPSAPSISLPGLLTLPNSPQIRVASVAGHNAPTTPLGSLQGSPDIVIPTTQANPVNVAIEAANIPIGTVVQVTITPVVGTSATTNSSPLAGTVAASTATANVTLPQGLSVISVLATINIATTAQTMSIGGGRVARLEVSSTYGGQSRITYITQSGRRIHQ